MKERLYPIVKTLWALITSSIDTIKIFGLQETGKLLVQELNGESTIEKLMDYELGEDNFIIISGDKLNIEPKLKIIILKICPFTMSYKNIPKWNDNTMKLVDQYNSLKMGAALHPICIIHQTIRNELKAYTVACRSALTNKIVYNDKILEKYNLDKEKIYELIKSNACVYIIESI